MLFSKDYPPLPQLGLWTFEPAFSPRFLPTLSLRSIFPTGQRFLPTLSPRSLFSNWSAVFTHLEPTILFSHWSAVSHLKSRDFRLPMSPRSSFIHWSAVSHTGNDMTSSICSRPIRSQSESQTSPTYYSCAASVSVGFSTENASNRWKNLRKRLLRRLISTPSTFPKVTWII